MAETAIDQDAKTILEQTEASIAEAFQQMLANDAMLTVLLTLTEIQTAEAEILKSQLAGEQSIISTSFSWGNEHRTSFVLPLQVAEGLLQEIAATNEAIDTLDVIFENWNVAASNVLAKSVDPQPSFEPPESETRELGDEDLAPGSLLYTYDLTVGEKSFTLHRIVPEIWADMIRSANLEVTTVDDLPDLPQAAADAEPEGVQVEGVEFGDLKQDSGNSGGHTPISMLYDLKLDLVVELGRTRKQIKEILDIGKGSIIELDKLAGDPLEIFVNDRKLAEGEVVVVDDHFGIRITNLANLSERIRSLGDT